MVRPIYAHEMCDPDFSWLINTFRENNPEYVPVESSCLPVILINFGPKEGVGNVTFEKDQYPDYSEDEETGEPAKEPQKRPA